MCDIYDELYPNTFDRIMAYLRWLDTYFKNLGFRQFDIL